MTCFSSQCTKVESGLQKPLETIGFFNEKLNKRHAIVFRKSCSFWWNFKKWIVSILQTSYRGLKMGHFQYIRLLEQSTAWKSWPKKYCMIHYFWVFWSFLNLTTTVIWILCILTFIYIEFEYLVKLESGNGGYVVRVEPFA